MPENSDEKSCFEYLKKNVLKF